MDFVHSPTLVLDRARCQANIERMVRRARRFGAELCPHMKTHQSADIGGWIREAGVTAITVSSVDMAAWFVGHGWDDITIAFPVNILEVNRINELTKNVSITILVSDPDVLPALEDRLTRPVRAFIEVDSGAGRTGVPWDATGEAGELLDRIGGLEMVSFRGFYSHPGHSYSARSAEEIREINRSCVERLTRLRDELTGGEVPIRMGDTPCCSAGEAFEGIQEWSPGNFVFYDLMQVQIGACGEEDIAVALACPVVARHPGRGEVTVHGGAVHLSKERLTETDGREHFGRVVRFTEEGWSGILDGCFVTRLSQEHGLLSLSREVFEAVRPGDLLGVLPVHSCLTADLMGGYRTVDGESLNHMRGRRT